ncbi:phosphotransferase enzyme family protein [Streptomyces sp. NPDC001414]
MWHLAGGRGGPGWYLKVHANLKLHAHQVQAYLTWVPRLGAAAPRLVAVGDGHRAVLVTAVPGRAGQHVEMTREQEQDHVRRIGALAGQIHAITPPRPAPIGSGPSRHETEWHLEQCRDYLDAADSEFLRCTVDQVMRLPAPQWVQTHGDFRLGHLLVNDGSLSVIDFERSRLGPAVSDLARLAEVWAGRPDLYDHLLAGYGGGLDAVDRVRLVMEASRHALAQVRAGARRGDYALVSRGRRTLRHLRASSSRAPGPAAAEQRRTSGQWPSTLPGDRQRTEGTAVAAGPRHHDKVRRPAVGRLAAADA